MKKSVKDKIDIKLPNDVDFSKDIRGIFIFAAKIFRDTDTAKQWMSERQPALGGYVPIDLLETKAGAKEVYSLLGRIKYGVIS